MAGFHKKGFSFVCPVWGKRDFRFCDLPLQRMGLSNGRTEGQRKTFVSGAAVEAFILVYGLHTIITLSNGHSKRVLSSSGLEMTPDC